MTYIKKCLSDLVKGRKHLSTWKVIAALFIFCAITALTFGAAPIALAFALIMHPDGTNISGRSQGTVFQRNGIRRNFVMTPNPRSPLQMQRRNALSFFSAAWRALSTADIASWRNLTMQVTNRLGQTKTIKGKTVYVRLNSNLDLIGVPGIDTAPVLEGSQGPEFATKPSIDESDEEIQTAADNADAAYGLVVYASKAVPNGRTTGIMSEIYHHEDSTAADPTRAWDGYEVRYGVVPVNGQTIKVGYQFVNNTTGEASGIVSFLIVVQA